MGTFLNMGSGGNGYLFEYRKFIGSKRRGISFHLHMLSPRHGRSLASHCPYNNGESLPIFICSETLHYLFETLTSLVPHFLLRLLDFNDEIHTFFI